MLAQASEVGKGSQLEEGDTGSETPRRFQEVHG